MSKLAFKNLKIGSINSLDFIPLATELEYIQELNIELYQENFISDLELKLKNKEVDIAILPSTYLINNYELALPIGLIHVAHSNIFLTFNQESLFLLDIIKKRIESLKEISQHVNFDASGSIKKSASFILDFSNDLPAPKIDFAPQLKILTSNPSFIMLAKIFYRLIFGNMAYEALVSKEDSNSSYYTSLNSMEITVGSEIGYKRAENKKTLDLIHFWHTITGLPFVSWVMLKKSDFELPLNWYKKLIETADITQAKMRIDPSSYGDYLRKLNSKNNLEDLNTEIFNIWKHIKYRFSTNDIKGLLMFLCLTKNLTKLKTEDIELTKLLRWKYTDKAYINGY